MKVDSKNIANIFDEIKYILLGIEETMRSGDDGFEDSIIRQSEDIKTMIGLFTAEHMTPVEPAKTHKFLDEYLKNEESRDKSYSDNVNLVKAKIYLWLKRELAKLEIPIKLAEQDAHNYLYEHIVSGTSSEHWFDGAFSKAAYVTLELVVKEMYEQRRKFPQLAMFGKSTTTESKKLLDKLL